MANQPSPEFLALQKAVQELANAKNGRPMIIKSAIVVWEEVFFDDEGDMNFDIDFASVGDNVSLATETGLLKAGLTMFEHIVLHGTPSPEDS